MQVLIDKEEIDIESNIDRIEKDIENIAKITATPGLGCTRFSYSKEDKEVRKYLINSLEKMGLDIKVDGVGNIRAKYMIDENKDKPSIMIGSHIDTVQNGGKFDGLLGVVTALEVVRILSENKIELGNPVEFIVFAEEEGSNFGTTMVGSKALTGAYKLKDLIQLKNDEGESAYGVMKNFGLEVDKIESQVLKKSDVNAMIELHVEQGGILEKENLPIGIVEAIVGMKSYKIIFNGSSNHAGTTPMNLRKDPMIGVAEMILHLKDVAKNKALKNTVATVGKIHAEPNASNVIASQVEIFVDIRDVETEGIEIVSQELKSKAKELEEKYGLGIEVKLVGESDVVKLSQRVVNTIEEVAKDGKYNFKKMNSGAVHDAVMLTNVTDVGMIFVPSISGKSHCPEEMTEMKDIKVGCDLLLETVIKLGEIK